MSLMQRKRKGYALLLTVVAAFFLGSVTVAMFRLQAAMYQNMLNSRYREITLRAAEAAVERAIQQISFNPDYTTTTPVQEPCWPGASGSVVCSYEYTVSGTGSQKTINATGKVTMSGFGGKTSLTVVVQRNPGDIVILSWEEH